MRHCAVGSILLLFIAGCSGSVVNDDDSPDSGTGGTSSTGGTLVSSGGTGGTAAGTGGASVGTGGQTTQSGGSGGAPTNLGGMGGESMGLGGQGGASEDPSIPWEVTAILVNDPNPNAGPDDKRIIVWSQSTYDCSEPNGTTTCTLGRDHGRLSVPIAAEQFVIGSYTMANHAVYSATGPNTGVDDCWGGGGTLDGDVQVKSVTSNSLVVRLSNLWPVDDELQDLFEGEDIEVVICQ